MQKIKYKIGPSKLGNIYFYSETDQLGQGAFATVYKGTQDFTGELVAIKVIKDYQNKLKKDQNLKKTLNSEIETQLLLRNKHIVDLLDYIEDSRNIYIVQEFCNGGTLDAVLKERKRFEEIEAKMIFTDLLEACWELYENKIVHRDLKPDNILISSGIYKIADFGFADKMEKQTCSNIGTPLYMSPQQQFNQPTKKSDIWSLGVIYYQLIYGYQTTPWGHLRHFRDNNHFKKTMMNNPLYFNPEVNISPMGKQFICECLDKNEESRLSWDQLFQHKYFEDFNKKFKEKIQKKQIQNQSQNQDQNNNQNQNFVQEQPQFNQHPHYLPQQQQQQQYYQNINQQIPNQYQPQYNQFEQKQQNIQQPQNLHQQQQQQQYQQQQQPQQEQQQQQQIKQQNQKLSENYSLDEKINLEICGYCEAPFLDEKQFRNHQCPEKRMFYGQKVQN